MLSRADFEKAVAALGGHGKVKVSIIRQNGEAHWLGQVSVRVVESAIGETLESLLQLSRLRDGVFVLVSASMYQGPEYRPGATIDVYLHGRLADPVEVAA